VRSHYFVSHAVDVIGEDAWDVHKSWAESFGTKTIGVGETIERENDHIDDAKSCRRHAFERDAKRLWAFDTETQTIDVGLQFEVNVQTVSHAQHEGCFHFVCGHCGVYENVEHKNGWAACGDFEWFVWEIWPTDDDLWLRENFNARRLLLLRVGMSQCEGELID
jgi:hypothetical protein